MSIPLRVGWYRVSVDNPQFTAIFPKGLAVKLEAIVRDQGVWGPELGDDIFLDKLLDIDIPYVCQRFSLDLFREVIGADEKKLLVPGSFGERP